MTAFHRAWRSYAIPETVLGQRTLGPAIDRKCGPPQQKGEREERLRKTVALEKPDKTPFIHMADAFCPRPGT